jgi:hypothetical protein
MEIRKCKIMTAQKQYIYVNRQLQIVNVFENCLYIRFLNFEKIIKLDFFKFAIAVD